MVLKYRILRWLSSCLILKKRVLTCPNSSQCYRSLMQTVKKELFLLITNFSQLNQKAQTSWHQHFHWQEISLSEVLFLLQSQLYLWGSPFWVRFLRMWPFFNPTTLAATFCLQEWCMLGVFLLPAFNYLRHECQDLWVRVMEYMYTQTRSRFILELSFERNSGMESEPMLTAREKSPLPEAHRRVEPATLHQAGQPTQHTTHWAIPACPEVVLEYLEWIVPTSYHTWTGLFQHHIILGMDCSNIISNLDWIVPTSYQTWTGLFQHHIKLGLDCSNTISYLILISQELSNQMNQTSLAFCCPCYLSHNQGH